MSRPSLVIVILEDDRQKMLVYKYLIKTGLRRHEIRQELSPSGHGSAESWVRTRFAKETIAYRERQNRAQTALLVMIDADVHIVQSRFDQLDEALNARGNQPVGRDERIARLVPRRNVETWILCLNGHAVDEQTNYKQGRSDWNRLTLQASNTLVEWARSGAELPNYCVESLQIGVGELRRLRF